MFHPKELVNWLSAIQRGDVVAAPAEGAYGYMVDPFNPAALEKLYQLKQRQASKGFICLIGHYNQLAQLCLPLSPAVEKKVKQYWFNPLDENEQKAVDEWPVTMVLPAKPGLPTLLTGGLRTIAVRCPRPHYMQEYMDAWSAALGEKTGGPLVSTSLNLAGQSPAIAASQIPANIPALKLPQALAGRVSRIYDPLLDVWLR